MTTLRQSVGWAMAGVAVILSGLLAFVYSRTQGYGESEYFEDLAVLRQIQQLDARWELDALKSKIGINSHYDPLADHLRALEAQHRQLEAVVARRRNDGGGTLEAAETAFHQAMEEKIGLVERFKSRNSVLRNSLTFLPTAAEDVEAAALRPRDAIPAGVAAEVGHVLTAALLYSQSGAGERAADIEAGLVRLASLRPRLPAEAGERLDIFTAHAATILREHPQVNDLLERIAAVPTGDRVEAIAALLAGTQHQAAARASHYRQYLLLFSLALIALLVYAAISLVHSHGVIARVNRELQEANAGLEQRVEERTRELRAAQDEVVATARRAGMAEIATNVLHNVGNVLNSVNVSAGVVSARVRDSKSQGLAKAVQLINDHADDLPAFLSQDPKGKLLPDYLAKLSEALAEEQRGIADELGALTRSIDHIKDIVATQQSYAGSASLVAPVQVVDLVEDALRMNAGALSRHEVTVVKEFAPVPVLPLDRHRVLQILVNLISNAKHAMDGGSAHRMTLKVGTADGESGKRLLISVADEGEGIPPENLTRIFNHGFTTRRNGHGFGLHSCILAAREMGGTLVAHSDGVGKGAVFTLQLPIDPVSAP